MSLSVVQRWRKSVCFVEIDNGVEAVWKFARRRIVIEGSVRGVEEMP